MSRDVRHRLGSLGERLAADHLLRRGFQIVERNYRTRWGELDIIAFDGSTLAFCEVKTRRATAGGRTAFESIRERKQFRIRKMAAGWLAERDDRPFARIVRFDAIAVTFDRTDQLVSVEHLEGAF
jgi:putative endonuclease